MRCETCGKLIPEPNVGYGISPDAVCVCCKHDRKPIIEKHQEPVDGNLGGSYARPEADAQPWSAQVPPNQEPSVPDKVIKFLLGEAELDGRWFGDSGPEDANGRQRNFWWRKYLHQAEERK